jgi:hypothetical protein|tara:strand:- start:185 stop:457 length:273 start_codon:yes stop_codon:yes gene_type:complete
MSYVYPKSIESAAEILNEALSQEELDSIKKMKENDLWELHMNLGQGIRNSMGLWKDNKELLRSCGSEEMHPDDASSAIVKFLWLKLRHEK